MWLKPFVGSRGERFKYLERIKQSTVACTSPAADGKNLVPLYQAIYKETKPLAETNDEQSIADGFLSWIDILEHGVKESEKTTTDRTKKRDRQP